MKNSDIIRIFMARVTPTGWAMNLNDWGWNTGVMIYCMSRLYEESGDPELYAYIKSWIDNHMEKEQFGSVNFVIPAHGLLTLTNNADIYKEKADKHAKWCKEDALLTCDGGFAHVWGNSDSLPDYENQLWLDSLYMTTTYMVRYGLKFGDEEIIEKALKQIDIHMAGAFDEETGLCFHAYHSKEKRTMGQRWGRGNGWVAAALADVILMLDGKKWNLDKYKRLVTKMIRSAYDLRCREDNMLHTVIDNPNSYTEYTATMLFSIAVFDLHKLSLIDKEIYEWAKELAAASPKMIGDKGPIEKCSAGTEPDSMESYLDRAFTETFYAYGLFMMLNAHNDY